MRRLLLLALAALALAGCGSSGSSSQRSQIVDRCIADGSSRTACTCTIDAATAQGMDLAAIARQENQGISGADRRLVAAGFACYDK